MAVNKGVVPLDPATPVGNLRLILGDVTSAPLVPPETGFGSYELFSDDELEAFLAQGESTEGAAYLAYLQLAGSAALSAKDIQDFDLKIRTEKRAEYLLKVAQMWGDKADALSADIFEIFDVNIDSDGVCVPELAPRPWGVRSFRGC